MQVRRRDPYRRAIALLAVLPGLLFLLFLLQTFLPAGLKELFIELAKSVQFLTPPGALALLVFERSLILGDGEVGFWRAYAVMLALPVLLCALVGGMGYLRAGKKAKTLPLSSEVPEPSQADHDGWPVMRGEVFWFFWLGSVLVPASLLALAGNLPLWEAPQSFKWISAGLLAIVATVLSLVLGLDALSGRPGHTFRSGGQKFSRHNY